MSRQQYTGEDPEEGYQPSAYSSKSKYVPDESIPARKLWLYGFCACIILSLVVVVGIVVFSWYRGGVDHHHVDQMIAELNEDNTMQLDTKNMVSFSALSTEAQSTRLIKNANRLSLCYADLLKSDADDGKSPLYVNVDQLSEDKNPFYYMLDLKLSLTFDVNALLYMREPSLQYETGRRYMTIAYLITSTYTRFSTIKLVETGLDAKNRALIRTNEIILCSDNPALQSTRACTNTLTDEGSLFIKNTKLLTMSKLVPWGIRKNTTSSLPGRVTTSMPPLSSEDKVASENGQYDIVHTDGRINTYKLADDFTRDLRMYNIIFYRAIPGNSEEARYSTFKETPVLTLKPNKCK